jgi:hypothetical protein
VGQAEGAEAVNGNGSSDRLDRIEAALDRLTARHEALSQTVEIIAGMQAKNEKLMAEALDAILRARPHRSGARAATR